MNITVIEGAIRSGKPFVLKMADGESFEIPHQDFISLPPPNVGRRNFVIVFDQEGIPCYLSLIAITSLRYLEDAPA